MNARALAKVFVSAADLEIAQSLQQWFTTPANQALLENLGKVGFSLAASEAELAAAARAEAEGLSRPGGPDLRADRHPALAQPQPDPGPVASACRPPS